jgi:hypothetical protein
MGATAAFLCVVAFMWQLLFLMLIAMGYLLFKNKHRAKAFLVSFLNFEVVLVLEVRPFHHPFDRSARFCYNPCYCAGLRRAVGHSR